MGSGQSQNRGVPGGGIAGLAPQVGGQMGGFGQIMNQAMIPPGGQYGAPLPGTPGMFPTQQQAAQSLMDQQQATQFAPQLGMGGFGGGQQAMPLGMTGDSQTLFPTQSSAMGAMGGGMGQQTMGPFAQAARRQRGFGASLFGGSSNPMAAGLGAIRPRSTGGRPAGFEGSR